jgi:bacteriorhodopsin
MTSAARVGIKFHYTILAGWTVFLWLLYPIAYGLDDGGNKIRVTSGFVFFGILDVLLVPVLTGAFLVLANRWDYGEMNLRFTQYGRVAVGANFTEKPEKAVIPPAPTAEAVPEQTV